MKRNFLLLVPRLSQSSHSSWLKASLLTLAALNNRTCVAFVNESRERAFPSDRCRSKIQPCLPSTFATSLFQCVLYSQKQKNHRFRKSERVIVSTRITALDKNKKGKGGKIFSETEGFRMEDGFSSLRQRYGSVTKGSQEKRNRRGRKGRVESSVDKGMMAKTDTSGRKTGGIIALIDQSDNSISICVIQMVFNFPQRYLHSSIYISFVRKCLTLRPPTLSSGLLIGLAFLPLFVSHLKTTAFRICMSLISPLTCFCLVRSKYRQTCQFN